MPAGTSTGGRGGDVASLPSGFNYGSPGGGGGGGYYGGAGGGAGWFVVLDCGANAGGGGGGSNLVPSGGTFTNGVRAGHGLVTITYTEPQPPPSIGAFTLGYWKNHLANSKAQGPFYSTECATVSRYGGSCSTNGPWTIQYLPKLLGNYSVDTITKAAQVFKAANCSSTKPNDAIGCLAGQLLATKLSLANGSLACPSILQAVADADAFLKGQIVNGVPGINYVGPGGGYTLTSAQRALAIALKSKLDAYNNNVSCP